MATLAPLTKVRHNERFGLAVKTDSWCETEEMSKRAGALPQGLKKE